MMTDSHWQNHHKSIADKKKYIFENNLWSDCTFVINKGEIKEEFKVHKFILSLFSPVFESMFHSGLSESVNGIISIEDTEPEIFAAMLKYIYYDEVTIESVEQGCDLYRIADKYFITLLQEHCINYLLEKLNCINVCFIYEFAKLYDKPELINKCVGIIRSKTSSIVSDPNFTTAQLSTVKVILQNIFNINEIDLFYAVERWIKAEFEKKDIVGSAFKEEQEAICKELLPYICFLNMKPEEFVNGPALSSLLNTDQAFAILMNLISPDCNYPMPTGFSTNKRIDIPQISYVYLGLSNYIIESSTKKRYSHYFQCNKNVVITGVRVKKRYYRVNNNFRESITVTISNHMFHRSTNVSINYSDYWAPIDIHFPSPIDIFQQQLYFLNITVDSERENITYNKSCNTTTSCSNGDVQFDISSESNRSLLSIWILTRASP